MKKMFKKAWHLVAVVLVALLLGFFACNVYEYANKPKEETKAEWHGVSDLQIVLWYIDHETDVDFVGDYGIETSTDDEWIEFTAYDEYGNICGACLNRDWYTRQIKYEKGFTD